MQKYILKRLGEAVVTLAVVSFIVFMLAHLTGDPALVLAPPDSTKVDVELLRKNLGLDRPLLVQYAEFLGRVARGDLGRSWARGQPVLEVIIERFPNSFLLAGAALVFSIGVGVPVGILSAFRKGGFIDNLTKVFALMGQSIPTFWTGIMLILIVSVLLGLLPTFGMGSPKHLIMPAFTLGWYSTAAMTRLSRSAMLDVLDSEYIKMVRIKGMPEALVIGKHALKNASLPIITLASLQFILLMNGAIITETVFAWPGIGRLVVESVFKRDFPMVQGIVLLAGTMFIMTNLLVDIIYAYVDPRIRYQ